MGTNIVCFRSSDEIVVNVTGSDSIYQVNNRTRGSQRGILEGLEVCGLASALQLAAIEFNYKLLLFIFAFQS